jgi:hypothetical protein
MSTQLVWTAAPASTYVDPTEFVPSPSPTPTLPTGPLPTVRPVPTGAWTGINWLAIPGGHSPALPGGSTGGGYATLEGWSKGYVEFMWNPANRYLTPWVSADGLTWSSGAKLDTSPWQDDFRIYDQGNPKDRAYHDNCSFQVGNFQEGPTALLLSGHVLCSPGCSGAGYYTSEAAWTSSDGVSWKLSQNPPGVLVSGGSSGFISFGADGTLGPVWTSSDGQTWTQGALPALAAGSWVNSPVAISGGFVLPGVIMVKKGHIVPSDGSGGCGMAGSDQSLYQAALWWSPDGKTWTRDTLKGTTSGYFDGIDMSVTRIDDHTVVASESFGSTNSQLEWVSKDGKTWTSLKDSSIYGDRSVVAGRDRGLVYGELLSGSKYWQNLLSFSGGLTLTKLHQTGDIPWTDWPQMVLGPSGLLVTVDGSQFWVGVPTTG